MRTCTSRSLPGEGEGEGKGKGEGEGEGKGKGEGEGKGKGEGEGKGKGKGEEEGKGEGKGEAGTEGGREGGKEGASPCGVCHWQTLTCRLGRGDGGGRDKGNSRLRAHGRSEHGELLIDRVDVRGVDLLAVCRVTVSDALSLSLSLSLPLSLSPSFSRAPTLIKQQQSRTYGGHGQDGDDGSEGELHLDEDVVRSWRS